jgi:SAM-dependent methyltransferase
MEHEGMVHALEEIHRLLRPAGTLIEIHPSLEPPPSVEVRSDGGPSFSEDDPGFDYADDLRQAEAAVATVVDRGVFALEGRRGFELRTYAASVEELRDYWAVYDAYDPEETEETLARRRDAMYERAAAAMDAAADDAEVIYVEPATMSRLLPIG